MGRINERILFGAAYYHEYQPVPRLEQDLDLMQAAHFSVIRVGESTWSTWEPEDDRFELEWLQPVLDGARLRGISVILGTPTYAVPLWLTRKYPELAGERKTGQRIPWGSRQEVDFTHPAFRFHAERVIRRIVERYADHPSVIGFQLDNEPGLELLHNRGVFQSFVDHLRHTYGDVTTLNREWGLTYWSHRLSTWSDLWTPDGNAQPQYDLAWRQFQADLTTAFVGWQADIVRSLALPNQFVTTCISYERPAVNDQSLSTGLDSTAGNLYYEMQDALEIPWNEHALQGWRTTGVWSLYLSADRLFASRQEQFLVTETNAGSIGESWTNRPGYDGQYRQVAWALVARGAEMIEYWHWHTLHYGTETHWVGVLPHDELPGRVYRELSGVGEELARAGREVVGLLPDADVGFLYSHNSKWALGSQPALALEDGRPDSRSYDNMLEAFYRGSFAAGLQARIIHDAQIVSGGTYLRDPTQFAASIAVLVVPALYVASDALLEWLRLYAEAGGHLLLGVRTGYADSESRARMDVKPALLSRSAGVSYQEFSNPFRKVPVKSTSKEFVLPEDVYAWGWIDHLIPATADILAAYVHPQFSAWPALVTQSHGAGRITTAGCIPDQRFAKALFVWLVPENRRLWGDRPPSVTATSAHNPAGQRLWFLHNWSWNEVYVRAPMSVREILRDTEYSSGDSVCLGPWDVRVVIEIV